MDKSWLPILLVAATLSACTADVLMAPGGQYGPSDGPQIGIVRYLAEGASSVIEDRRNDAYKKMYESCGGHYKILAEGSRDKVYGAASQNFAGFGSQEYVYIKYQCITDSGQ